MDIDEVYRLMTFIVKKNMQGFFKPADFFTAINSGQRQYQSWLLGSLQQYTPGRPVAKVELGQNSVVRQRLTAVITSTPLTIDNTGFSTYPDDYLQTDAMWTTTGFKRIRYVEQNALDAYYNSTIDPIATNPIYLIEDLGFRFYPVTTATAKLSYVQNAPDMVWAYTDDVNGRPVYDSVNSVQPVWDDVAMFDIISRALLMLGVNLQSPVIMQYANEVKNTGQ